jgi:hypothetical protein
MSRDVESTQLTIVYNRLQNDEDQNRKLELVDMLGFAIAAVSLLYRTAWMASGRLGIGLPGLSATDNTGTAGDSGFKAHLDYVQRRLMSF